MKSAEITQTLKELHARYQPESGGKLADYIPELAKANPARFGIAVTDVQGQICEAGDTSANFTLQSISKPFIYGMALEDRGREAVRARVGVEPTGNAFNSIIELERDTHRPYNPMINSGAIAVTDLITGAGNSSSNASDKLNRILAAFGDYAGHAVNVDVPVFMSERNTGHRNRAIAHLLRHFHVVGAEMDATLDLYFQQCSILMNTRDLAVMAATLANGGKNPITGVQALKPEFVRDLLSLMLSCGMYDSSGEWTYTVGIPAKSGVSGGILGVVPGRMGIAVYSPPLDPCGHSVRGIEVFRELSQRWRLSMFEAQAPV
jgi:glutaminase